MITDLNDPPIIFDKRFCSWFGKNQNQRLLSVSLLACRFLSSFPLPPHSQIVVVQGRKGGRKKCSALATTSLSHESLRTCSSPPQIQQAPWPRDKQILAPGCLLWPRPWNLATSTWESPWERGLSGVCDLLHTRWCMLLGRVVICCLHFPLRAPHPDYRVALGDQNAQEGGSHSSAAGATASLLLKGSLLDWLRFSSAQNSRMHHACRSSTCCPKRPFSHAWIIPSLSSWRVLSKVQECEGGRVVKHSKILSVFFVCN